MVLYKRFLASKQVTFKMKINALSNFIKCKVAQLVVSEPTRNGGFHTAKTNLKA